MDRYTKYVIDEMIRLTEFNSIKETHDQVLPPWLKDINILPNILEYDEWLLDWGGKEFEYKPAIDLQKDRNMWDTTIEHFYMSSDKYLTEKYGAPDDMRRDISKKYRKRLREVVNYHRIKK